LGGSALTPRGTRRLDSPFGEQGKLPAAKAFRLAEKDKHMSEQKLSYMAQLDRWTDEAVVAPLLDNGIDAIDRVRKAIREKVLESYRNGQAAGTKPSRKEPKYAQAKVR
jgi:hypothetical protein